MSDSPAVLQVRGVTKRFGHTLANDDISLTLHRGEVLGLLGENGAGKSTLVKIMYGLYRADAGEILIDGRQVTIADPRDAVRRGVGMVHQHFTLVPPLTVAENVVLGAEPRGAGLRGSLLDGPAAEAAVRRLARRCGLAVDPSARVADLSVGEQQRVEILKALYREARILILDEPTAVLTPQETDELFGVLRSLVADGLSVILITHKLGELLSTADTIAVIRDGRVIDTLPAASATREHLATLMVGREVNLSVDHAPSRPGPVRLEARNLRVGGARGAVAVQGVSLAVRGGEILAVAGVDGNGQLELAEALAGIRPVLDGSVLLDGRDVTGLGPVQRRERGLAYIPEDRLGKGLVRDFTLAENLALTRHRSEPYSRRGWLRPAAMRRAAAERLRAFDVRPADPDASAGALSGGNQQKAVVARELEGEPGVLIAAQPTRGVDVGAIEFIHGRLLAERDRGAAILLLSLELEEIHALADRIAVLSDGRIVGEVARAHASDEQLGLWMAGHTSAAAGAQS